MMNFSQTPPTNCSSGNNCLTNLPNVSAGSDQLEKILAIVFGVIAAVSVLIIITAAIDFANNGGDPEKISKAKKTIIYALVGLVIAISAEFIVLTLLGRL